MGPLADDAFLYLLHKYSPADCDQEHIDCVVDMCCSRTDRSDFLLGKSDVSPLSSLVKSAVCLAELGCDCIVMPCNTAHFWYAEILKAIPKNVVFPSMVKLCAASAFRKSKNIALLSTVGTRISRIYENEGLIPVKLPEWLEAEAIDAVKSIKSGEDYDISSLLYRVSEFSDGVILGCTELSRALVLGRVKIPEKLFVTDSLSVLARFAIERYYKKKIFVLYS